MSVIDFNSKAFWKQLEARFDRMRTDINYAGITRHSASANQASDDPISFDAETAARVREVFEKYGFPAQPQTWAEFGAVHAYIERVEEAVDTFRIGYRHIPEHGIDFLRVEYADVIDVVMLTIEGDYAKLASFHKKQETFKQLVRDYDEVAELPDAAPRTFVPWPPHLR